MSDLTQLLATVKAAAEAKAMSIAVLCKSSKRDPAIDSIIAAGEAALAAQADAALRRLDLPAIEAALERAEAMESELAELLIEAFHEIATEGKGDRAGWWCSNGRSTAVGHADRLVELGRYEKSPDGHGRVQWYRPVSATKETP